MLKQRFGELVRFLSILFALVLGCTALRAEGGPVELFKVDIDSLIDARGNTVASPGSTYRTLLAKKDVRVRQGGTFVETTHFLHEVTSSEGTRQLGEYDIIYRKGKDSVTINRAQVISPDGKKEVLPLESILSDMHIQQELDNQLQTENRFIRLIFPGLKVGSIVELQYTLDNFREALPGFSGSWSFSLESATMLSVASVSYPKSFHIYSKTQLFDGETFSEEAGASIQETWIERDVPPILREPGSPPIVEYTSWVRWSSFSSWKSLGNTLYGSLWESEINEQLSKAEVAYFDGLQLDTANKFESAKALYYAVQTDIRYVGFEIGINTIRPHASRLTCESRFGDCKDMTLLLIRLLRLIGVEAHPALASTNDVSIRLDSVFADFETINHVVAYIPDLVGKQYWLDATAQFAEMSWIPVMCEGSNALILDNLQSRLVDVPVAAPETKLISSSTVTHMEASGSASFSDVTTFPGVTGLFYKLVFKYGNDDEVRNFVHQHFIGDNSSISNISYAVSGLSSNDSAFVFGLDMVDSAFAQPAGNLMIVGGGPISGKFDVSGLAGERKTDVYVLNAPSYARKTELHLPANYVVEYRRPDKTMRNDFFDYDYSATVDSQNVWTSQSRLMIKARYIPLAKYPEYRSLVEQLNAHGRENLVLKRVSD